MPFCHLPLRAGKPLPPGWPGEVRTLGDRIRKRRLELGLTQEQLAGRLGVGADTIGNWEKGRSLPALRVLSVIARFLAEEPTRVGDSFGDHLRAYRRLAGLSQARLAILLGIDESTVNSWESRRHRPTKTHERKVEEFLAETARNQGVATAETGGG